jgi:hypothetical protein
MRRLLPILLAACGAKPTPMLPPTSAPAPAPATPSAAPEPSASATTDALLGGLVMAPARDSHPAGVHPLDAAEQAEVEKGCKKLVDAVAAVVKKKNPSGRLAATTAMLEALAKPPEVAGVDVPRCAELVRRDLEDYLASAVENEAIASLRMIALALARVAQSDGVVCASAPAAPADVAKVRSGSYVTTAADWAGEGWRCNGFGAAGMPVRWQYEVKVDATRRTYDIIARGFPVSGGPQAELVLPGGVDDEQPGEVMRR